MNVDVVLRVTSYLVVTQRDTEKTQSSTEKKSKKSLDWFSIGKKILFCFK